MQAEHEREDQDDDDRDDEADPAFAPSSPGVLHRYFGLLETARSRVK